jgi:hypothetical protein
MVYMVGCSWFVMRASLSQGTSSFGGSEVSQALARLGTFEVAPQRSAQPLAIGRHIRTTSCYKDITTREII